MTAQAERTWRPFPVVSAATAKCEWLAAQADLARAQERLGQAEAAHTRAHAQLAGAAGADGTLASDDPAWDVFAQTHEQLTAARGAVRAHQELVRALRRVAEPPQDIG